MTTSTEETKAPAKTCRSSIKYIEGIILFIACIFAIVAVIFAIREFQSVHDFFECLGRRFNVRTPYLIGLAWILHAVYKGLREEFREAFEEKNIIKSILLGSLVFILPIVIGAIVMGAIVMQCNWPKDEELKDAVSTPEKWKEYIDSHRDDLDDLILNPVD